MSKIIAGLLIFAAFTLSVAAQKTQNVSNNEIAGGLKEALSKGVSSAIKSLGKEDGFFGNIRVKIPLPKSLQKVEKLARFAGQGKAVDEFVLSMNRAAEKAVPVAIDVFVDAIKKMTFNDARQIPVSYTHLTLPTSDLV